MALERSLISGEALRTLRLLRRRLGRRFSSVPRIQQPILALRRWQHVRTFKARLREAASRRMDPYIDVARIVKVPAAVIRRHTAVPGDYYPTQKPGAMIPGDWDRDAWSIDEREYYIQLREALEGRRAWEHTELYADLAASAQAERSSWRRKEMLLEAREAVQGCQLIYESMKVNGYLSQRELAARRPSGYKPLQFDEMSVAVARDGELQVCQGGHRFAIAKAAGIPVLPVWIAARHTEWCDFRRRLIDLAGATGGRLAEPLLHPDLVGIPSSSEIPRSLERALGLLPLPPGRLVDVTPGWGYCAHRCEDLGFDCTVVADDAADREIIERLRVASRKGFTVARRLAEAVPAVARVDAVLGLRSFHECLSTEERRREFRAFLAAARPTVIVGTGSQEQLDFCADAAGLSSISSWIHAGCLMFRLS